MDIKQALSQVVEGNNLSEADMQAVMKEIMTGQCTDAQIGGFLVALRMKGETVEEITAAAKVMRELALPVHIQHTQAVDIVGTGGDGANLFNVSSASSFVVAAAGGVVAKHGNRSVSSKSGAADVLESAGINLALSAEQVAACIDQVGVGFMFAPNHHSAMKYAIGPRKEMAMRTIFNVLGPLTNPAGAKRYVLGVFNPDLCLPLAEALKNLGAEHALVVHASDGLDELTLAGSSHVVELKNGEITDYPLLPEEVGLTTQSLEGLQVADSQASLALIRGAFDGSEPKARDMIALNAGAALYVAGMAASHKEGVEQALAVMQNGKAAEKLAQLAAFTQGFEEK